MASPILLHRLLLTLLFSVVSSLPLGPSTPLREESSRNPLGHQPPVVWYPLQSEVFAPSYPAGMHWSTVSYQPVRTNQSSGQFPPAQFRSGPWDRAWEAWGNLSERMKLRKRSANFQVQEEIANHLRPKGWWQKVKDFWRRMTLRKLKVTAGQVEQIRQKYRPRYTQPSSWDRKNGRPRSTFPSRPGASQAPAFREKPSRFSRLS